MEDFNITIENPRFLTGEGGKKKEYINVLDELIAIRTLLKYNNIIIFKPSWRSGSEIENKELRSKILSKDNTVFISEHSFPSFKKRWPDGKENREYLDTEDYINVRVLKKNLETFRLERNVYDNGFYALIDEDFAFCSLYNKEDLEFLLNLLDISEEEKSSIELKLLLEYPELLNEGENPYE